MREKILASLILITYLITTSPAALIAEERRYEQAKDAAYVSALKEKINSNKKNQIKEDTDKGGITREKVTNQKEHIKKEKQNLPKVQTVKAEKKIIASDGGIIKLGKASIEIPSGALKNDCVISITQLEKVQETGESLYNAIPNFGGYRFLPAGTKFEKPVVITLPYDPQLNSKQQSIEDLYTYFYDVDTRAWVKLEKVEVNQEQCYVKSLTTHFTDMINATLTLPESASPVNVNLNSIKNLEAAKPDTHLLKFNPPQASPYGDASFSFDFVIPQGRVGMQPQLSLSYSSGNGNGIVGRGFNINYGSSIDTDTRHGVPSYDENDIYMLDGIILEKEENSKGIYKPLKESKFQKIIRHGAKLENYWEVINKDGSKQFYGLGDENSCVGKGPYKFTWNLTKSIDLKGNYVEYKYLKDNGYSYISEINYTGNENTNEKGKYKIVFNYNKARKDIRSNARSKEIVKCAWLLENIEVLYTDKADTQIRKYIFNYAEGLSKENRLVSFEVVNSDGSDSYCYNFEYNGYNDELGQIVTPSLSFDEPKKWSTEGLIQSGMSSSLGTNFSGSGGVGYGCRVADFRGTVGGSGSVATSDNYSEDSLIDINGDGRPDRIYKKNGDESIYVQLNNKNGFGQEEKIYFQNTTLNYDINSEESTSSSIGWNVYGGTGLKLPVVAPSLGAGYSEVYQNSTSSTRSSFMDVDGDGLVDIIESGSDKYFKNISNSNENNGNIIAFAERNIESAIKDVVKKLPKEVVDQYKAKYYKQTPFRQWKAPYDGILRVRENIKQNKNHYDTTNEVKTNIFLSSLKPEFEKVSENIVVPSGVDKVTNVPSIKKGDKLYLISDSGEEPRGKDIIWNAEVKYDRVKIFKDYKIDLILDYFITKEQEFNNNNLNKSFDSKEGCEEYIQSELKNLLNQDYLLGLFKTNVIIKNVAMQNPDREVAKYFPSVAFNPDWMNDESIDRNKIMNYLIENLFFIPKFYSEAQFNELIKIVENKSETRENLSNFVKLFSYDLDLDRFVLRELENYDIIKNYLVDLKKAELCNSGDKFTDIFTVNGMKPLFTPVGLKYETLGNGSNNTKKRTVNDIGAITSNGNNITIGFKKDNEIVEPIILDLKLNKLKIGNKTYNNIDVKKTDNKLDLYVYDDDIFDNQSYMLELVIDLGTINYRPYNIEEAEFNLIKERIIPFDEDISSSYWKIQKELTLPQLITHLIKLGLTEEEGNQIIDLLYEKKEIKEESKLNDNGKNKPVNAGEKKIVYVNKKNPLFAEAQLILDKKIKNIIAEKFPFFEKDAVYQYKLKEEWHTRIEEDVFKEKYKKQAELKLIDEFSKIPANQDKYLFEITNYCVLSGTDSILDQYFDASEETRKSIRENPQKLKNLERSILDNATNKLLNKWLDKYNTLSDSLEKYCKEFNLGNYSDFNYKLTYNNNYLYRMDIEDNSFNGKYDFYKLENDGIISIEHPIFGKVVWNSNNDFNNSNNISRKKIISTSIERELTESEKKYLPNDEKNGDIKLSDEIFVSDNEVLYGGINNWYYGIWKGPVNNFSKKTFEAVYNPTDIKNKDDFEKKKNDAGQIVDPQNIKDSDEIHFYLPDQKDNMEILNQLPEGDYIFENKEYKATEIDYNKALLGAISIKSDIIGDKIKNSFYMPFLYKDIIHCERVGGEAFYEIEGLSLVEEGASYSLPTIRKAYTEGTDTTPNINMSLGGQCNSNFSEAVDKDAISSKIQEVSGNIGLSKNKGTNHSTSKVMQSIQDINGDNIPDILQILEDGSLKISKGKIKHDRSISFNDSVNINTSLGSLSLNNSNIDVLGGSVSSSGSVAVNPRGSGKTVSVIQIAPPLPSGGITSSKGTSTQHNGLMDINGDGLSDYFGESVYINTGDDLKKDADWKQFDLTKSTSESFGMNFSLGTGGDLGQANSLMSSGSLNLGVSYSSSSSTVDEMLIDINGDGLQDKLKLETSETGSQKEFNVYLNTGNGFVDTKIKLEMPEWKNLDKNDFCSLEKNKQFDLGLIGQIPVIGGAISKGLTNIPLNSFGFRATELANSIEWNSSVTLGLSGNAGSNLNVGFELGWFGTLNFTASMGNGLNYSTTINSISVRMTDLDGDGLVDHVLRIPNEGIYWKRNRSGQIGLLKTIKLPQGGTCNLEYAESYGTERNPGFKYVMSSVTLADNDIESSNNSIKTDYEYEDGYYDRERRDFYGYGKITTFFADGTSKIDNFYNSEYYSKGMLESSIAYGVNGNKLTSQTNTITLNPVALVSKEVKKSYETNNEMNCITNEINYEYDSYGNVIAMKEDDLACTIEYVNDFSRNYVVNLPMNITVTDLKSNNKILRKREGKYNEYGELTELYEYINDNDKTSNLISYDIYGNIEKIVDPRGATLSYTYDKDLHQLVTSITQKGNDTDIYTDKIYYDPIFQTKLIETDCNNNSMQYEFDKWQRLVSIRTPYDTGIVPSVSYEYYTTPGANQSELWYAVTKNKVTFDPDDNSIMETVMFIDGLGRAKQTAKTGYVNGIDGWNVSGVVEYDEKGRIVKEGMTDFIEGATVDSLIDKSVTMSKYYNEYEYDEKDRQIRTRLMDRDTVDVPIIENHVNFYIEDSLLVTESIDPELNITVQKSDNRGNIIEVLKVDKNNNSNILNKASYKYNAIGEMLEAMDGLGNPIKIGYDLLGRKIFIESKDGGKQEFEYDLSSNLIFETNSVLKEKNQKIGYSYDGLNRLVKINYPDTPDTTYTYGGSSELGCAGRIKTITDASGSINYEYGSLGEITKETRTLTSYFNSSIDNQVKAEMSYKSDYLGRMQYIIYPDGEKVIYGYDKGGQVTSVTGVIEGVQGAFEYVKEILYDEYGQRTKIHYYNDVVSEYNYDPARRWLSSVKTMNKAGQVFQNIQYTFDKVGNISSYVNNCHDNGVTGNYTTEQHYGYDDLYQLISVNGVSTNNENYTQRPDLMSTYKQTFTFDEIGNLVTKTSEENTTYGKRKGDELNYLFNYEYDENYAHRLKRVGNRYYKYDSNGNLTCEQEGGFDGDEIDYVPVQNLSENVEGTNYGWGLFNESEPESKTKRYKRTYTWNEKNQLISSVDDNFDVKYVYGADGQRSNKYTNTSETLYFNKMWTLHKDVGNAVYGGQVSKNIYLGETRIATKLNSPSETGAYIEGSSKIYFYHSDHLGSASLITDYKGDEYQRLEYTPYGELWIEKIQNKNIEYLPYKFTGKEMDQETGLYYYGARYLDPKYSRWLSTDPELSDYIPGAPTSDEVRNKNSNLPGMGGLYNIINLHLYHYAGNNPVKYLDPNGRFSVEFSYFVGVGGKVKFGFNNGRFEFQWRLGVGFGAGFSVDLADESFVDDNSTGVYVGAEASTSLVPGVNASVEAEVGIVSDLDKGEIKADTSASGEVTAFNGIISGSVEVENGKFESPEINLESKYEKEFENKKARGNAKNEVSIFAGFGGQGYIGSNKDKD